MNDQPPDNLFSALARQTRRLRGELREFFVARWLLLQIELRDTFARARRLLLLASVLVIVLLSGWSLLLVALSDMLDGLGGLSRTAWAAILGGSLVLIGAVGALVASRRLRVMLRGFEQSLEELREDAAWFREWSGDGDSDNDSATPNRQPSVLQDDNESP